MIDRILSLALRILPLNRFSRSVIVLVGGTAFAQLIQLLASPVVTRLYSPEAFGLLAAFLSTVSLLNIVSSLRYETAITIPESGYESRLLVLLSTLLLLAITAATLLLIHFQGDWLLIEASLQKLIPYKYLLPIAILLYGLYSIFSNWGIRKKRFEQLSRVAVLKSISMVMVQLSAFVFGSLGLMCAQVSSTGFGILRLVKDYRADLRDEKKMAGIGDLLDIAGRYRLFPLFSMPSDLLNSAGRELTPILLASAFNPASAGMYFLATRTVLLPVTLITDANAKVFNAHAPDAWRAGSFSRLFMALYRQSLTMFAIPVALVALVAPYAFGAVFGRSWGAAGTISTILMPWVLMIALMAPVSSTACIADRQAMALVFEAILIMLRLGGLLVGIVLGSFMLAISLFSAGAAAGLFMKLLWYARIAGVALKSFIYDFARETGLALTVYGAGLLLFQNNRSVAGSMFIFIVSVFAIVRSCRAFRSGLDDVAMSPSDYGFRNL